MFGGCELGVRVDGAGLCVAIDAFPGLLERDEWYLLTMWSELKEGSAVEATAVVGNPGSDNALLWTRSLLI
jgi:hypothetical protein